MKRIAMWSGPRNISTAMMRSWENRKDTKVVDEPLYGPYLHSTGKKHPAYEEVIDAQGENWKPIVDYLTTQGPACCEIFYQKHMAHHLLEEMPIEWVLDLDNVFLIRKPEQVVASYLKKNPQAKPADLGFPQQQKLFEYIIKHTGETPIVLDSEQVLKEPEMQLKKLCGLLGVDFNDSMLRWPDGYRATDGVWAKHWYDSVIKSVGFAPYREPVINLDESEQALAAACEENHRFLKQFAI